MTLDNADIYPLHGADSDDSQTHVAINNFLAESPYLAACIFVPNTEQAVSWKNVYNYNYNYY
jgi:hypothetical protein